MHKINLKCYCLSIDLLKWNRLSPVNCIILYSTNFATIVVLLLLMMNIQLSLEWDEQSVQLLKDKPVPQRQSSIYWSAILTKT